jgi:hypothetical protein
MTNPKSQIPNPKSLHRPPRPGVTIVEVLFAIMVATIGIFSVIVIFPFASAQAKRARLNDMFAAAGRSAFHDFDTHGMRIPDQLITWDPNPASLGFQSLNELTQLNQPDFVWATVTPINFQKNEAMCIDPRFIGAWFTASAGLPAWCRTFPYQEPFSDANNDGICQSGETYTDLNNNGVHDPYQNSATFAGNIPSAPTSRQFDMSLMRRVTLRSSRTGGPMTFAQANAVFTIEDDIAYKRDDKDKSKPPTQDLIPLVPAYATSNPANEYLKRDSERNISWIATLVPQLNVSGVQSDEYTLSVVMIYERSNGDIIINPVFPFLPSQTPSAGGLAGDKFNERTVTGYCIGGGVTGGEFLLVSSDAEQLKVRPNQWIMVSGVLPAPNSTIGRFQWYRVTECDPAPTLNQSTSMYELNATLMGQDWNLSVSAPAPPSYIYSTLTAQGINTVRVTIVQGAFAVYEKTIRMEADSSF